MLNSSVSYSLFVFWLTLWDLQSTATLINKYGENTGMQHTILLLGSFLPDLNLFLSASKMLQMSSCAPDKNKPIHILLYAHCDWSIQLY